MSAGLRKLCLVLHIISSVGWIGAVAAFLALSVAGVTSTDADVIRAAFVGMDLIGRFVIVPLSFAALVTGVIQGLTTEWGLLRHYWVVVKFVLTILAIAALLVHQFIAVVAASDRALRAAAADLPDAELVSMGTQLTRDAILAIAVLVVATALTVFKPWGRTAYGMRLQRPPIPENAVERRSAGLRVVLVVVGVLALVFVALHLAGGGLHQSH